MPEKEARVITFDSCPNCGSKRRVIEELSKELKEKGLMRKEAENCVQVLSGVVFDKTPSGIIPVGAEVPAFVANTDICMGCGTYYVVKLMIGRAKLQKVEQRPKFQHGLQPPFDLNQPPFMFG